MKVVSTPLIHTPPAVSGSSVCHGDGGLFEKGMLQKCSFKEEL